MDVLQPSPTRPAEVSVHGGINGSLQVAAKCGTGRSGKVKDGRSVRQRFASRTLIRMSRCLRTDERNGKDLPFSQFGRGVP